MTSNDPGADPPPGDPADDATRPDWPIGEPQNLPAAQSLPPSAPPPGASGDLSGPPSGELPPGPPGGPPAAPSSTPPVAPPSTPPGYAGAPGYPPTQGYAPGYPPSTAPGMAWAPPPEVTAGPGVGGLEYAGALPRFVAWLVDGLILGFIGFVLFVVAAIVFAGAIDWSQYAQPGTRFGSADGGAFGLAIVGAAIIGALVELAYFVFFWRSSARATLGMRLLNLRVANAADGATLTMSQAVRRWIALGQWLTLFTYVPVVGAVSWLVQLVWYLVLLGTTVSSPTKQGVHDRFVGSVVVQPRGGSSNGLIVGCLVILAFLILVPFILVVALIFLGSQVSDILENAARSV